MGHSKYQLMLLLLLLYYSFLVEAKGRVSSSQLCLKACARQSPQVLPSGTAALFVPQATRLRSEIVKVHSPRVTGELASKDARGVGGRGRKLLVREKAAQRLRAGTEQGEGGRDRSAGPRSLCAGLVQGRDVREGRQALGMLWQLPCHLADLWA